MNFDSKISDLKKIKRQWNKISRQLKTNKGKLKKINVRKFKNLRLYVVFYKDLGFWYGDINCCGFILAYIDGTTKRSGVSDNGEKSKKQKKKDKEKEKDKLSHVRNTKLQIEIYKLRSPDSFKNFLLNSNAQDQIQSIEKICERKNVEWDELSCHERSIFDELDSVVHELRKTQKANILLCWLSDAYF